MSAFGDDEAMRLYAMFVAHLRWVRRSIVTPCMAALERCTGMDPFTFAGMSVLIGSGLELCTHGQDPWPRIVCLRVTVCFLAYVAVRLLSFRNRSRPGSLVRNPELRHGCAMATWIGSACFLPMTLGTLAYDAIMSPDAFARVVMADLGLALVMTGLFVATVSQGRASPSPGMAARI